jgi:sulfite exporter TauE/SafE
MHSLLVRETMNRTAGLILIVLGLVGLAWGGFTYTTREKVVDLGPIHASLDKTHTVPLPPVVGAIALVAGVVLLAAGKKQ